MTIIVNGQSHPVDQPLTVAELLRRLEISQRGTAVELNLQLLPRSQHAAHLLHDGDHLEIVSLVGGG